MNLYINEKSKVLREIEEVEYHLHNKELWYGAAATRNSLTGYTITSGNADFGAATQIFATTFLITGKVYFDLHRFMPLSVSSATVYVVRIIWGSGTVGDAETAGQYTDFTLLGTGVGANINGQPQELICDRIPFGFNVWMKCKNATNLATVTGLIGIHTYEE